MRIRKLRRQESTLSLTNNRINLNFEQNYSNDGVHFCKKIKIFLKCFKFLTALILKSQGKRRDH